MSSSLHRIACALPLLALLLTGCPKKSESIPSSAPPEPPAPTTAELCQRALGMGGLSVALDSPEVGLCVARFEGGTDAERALLTCQGMAVDPAAREACFPEAPAPGGPEEVAAASAQLGLGGTREIADGAGVLGVLKASGDEKVPESARRPGAEPIILGSLDKSLIAEVIKADIPGMRKCYEEGLTRDPSLAGKVVIKFVIHVDGNVSKASIKASELGDERVHSCLTARFVRLQFPEPKGGGIVIVSYPFVFAPG